MKKIIILSMFISASAFAKSSATLKSISHFDCVLEIDNKWEDKTYTILAASAESAVASVVNQESYLSDDGKKRMYEPSGLSAGISYSEVTDAKCTSR